MMNRDRGDIYLSVVIPAYNEEKRIGGSMEKIIRFLRGQPYASEVIVVDDGSSDATIEVVRRCDDPDSMIRIERQPYNLGKGEAIRRGMLAGDGRYLVFSDADLSVPIETLPAFLAQLENGCDIAVGSRRKEGAVVEIHQPKYRELMGKVFTRLSSLILGLRVSDFTCGFKGFRKEAARDLFRRQQLADWSFDSEILYLAKIRRYRMSEVPVRWRNDAATKVRLGKDVLVSFLGLLKIRVNDILGKYR
jgi:dolichyl-phosphate beta-glucosyltransferase